MKNYCQEKIPNGGSRDNELKELTVTPLIKFLSLTRNYSYATDLMPFLIIVIYFSSYFFCMYMESIHLFFL